MLEKKVLKKKEMTEIKDIAEELNKFELPNSSNQFTMLLNETHSIVEKKS